ASGADHLADVAPVEGAKTQPVDVLGLEAAMGDEAEGLRGAVEAEHAAEVDPGDVTHDLQGPLGGEHEVVATPGRHDDRMQYLELTATADVGCLGGSGKGPGGRASRLRSRARAVRRPAFRLS